MKKIKGLLIYVAVFIGGVCTADMVKPLLAKIPVIGGFLGDDYEGDSTAGGDEEFVEELETEV